jgi:hypothetical protein
MALASVIGFSKSRDRIRISSIIVLSCSKETACPGSVGEDGNDRRLTSLGLPFAVPHNLLCSF